MEKQNIKLEISYMSVLRVAIVVLGLLFFWFIRDILILFFVVLVVVAALSPIVDAWSRRINRLAAIALIYVLILAVLTLIGIIVIPPFVIQLQDLSHTLPNYAEKIVPALGNMRELVNLSQQGLSEIAQHVSSLTTGFFSATLGFFSGIIAFVTIIVLSFYLLIEEHGTKKFILSYLPLENREQVVLIVQKIGRKMGGWLRGQLMLSCIIGIVDWIGLSLLGVDFALTFGVWAGVTELIPYVGPVIGAIPAVILAFTISPLIGILALALYILVQQIEANILVPKIMQRAVGLSPVIIILALLIGAKVSGLIGIIIAIPVAAAVSVIIMEWSQIKDVYSSTKKRS